MSLNHVSSTLPQSLWWRHQYHPVMETQNNPIFYDDHREPPSPDFGFNLNTHNDDQESERDFMNTEITTTEQLPKEPMFEKPLTPSDVGKLNRLVIPKQHAEKHFPLGGGSDAADQQKGLLLSFEDESGKLWRFRYSYWNSSQSYVLTKGWSRYVKEKRLDAGDVVLFGRHRFDYGRMFIGWRRRSAAVPIQDSMAAAVAQPAGGGGAQVSGWNTRVFYDPQSSYPLHNLPLPLLLPHQPDCVHAGGVVGTRRLRLFGVNLDCPDDSEPSTPDGSSQDGQPYHQSNMGMKLNQMRYHQHQG